MFDANFSFADHVHNICKTCFIQIRNLRRVRKHLTDDAAILAANALVTSHLDYCNSLFRSLSSLNMRQLQCIQNTLARIVTHCNKYTRASPILKRLHWLPFEFCCIFKTATLVYKFLHNGHPSYFGSFFVYSCGRYSTRYNHPDKRFLEVPQFCPSVHKSKNHFGHSFAFDAPAVWNHLPDEVHSAPTLACFMKRLSYHIISLHKGISNLAYTLSGISVVLDLAMAMDRRFSELSVPLWDAFLCMGDLQAPAAPAAQAAPHFVFLITL